MELMMGGITESIILFIVGLISLIKGGDLFVDGATGIAHRFKMPEILIGATVVSIGTTLPEVMVSATAAVSGHSQIAYGNAIGSIICNTALILAITATFSPQKVERKSLITPVAFFFVAAGFYSGIAYLKGHFSRITGILLLCLFLIYMVKLEKEAKAASARVKAMEKASKKDSTPKATGKIVEMPGNEEMCASTNHSANHVQFEEQKEEILKRIAQSKEEIAYDEDGDKEKSFILDVVFLVLGAVLIAVGADLLVDNGTIIASALGVPESVIALTFVALGTSLPELVTAVTSLMKGHGALSLGNVIGANLFNLVLVSGMACTLTPFDVPASKLIAGMNSSLVIDIPLMLIVMLIATLPTLIKGKINRWQGVLLLCIYAGFCTSQFIM